MIARWFCWKIAVLTLVASLVSAQEPLQTITFQSSLNDFVNPERGFMRFRDLINPTGFDQVRSSGSGLIYGRILADDFRDRPLSDAFLNDLQAGFDLARMHGIKVKPRVTYNNGLAPDAPKAIVLQHIQQLQPIWETNKDVISHMDAGFIGAWGEWHSSSNGLDNNTDRTEILTAILDALPADRMVGIRTPHYKRNIYSGSPISDDVKITPETAFDGSDVSRVGHLNDCFLSSPTDFGTYAYTLAGWSRDREIDYIGGESRFAPFGGETCALHPLGESSNAMSEMERLHIDYLNRDYNRDVIQRWIDDGTYPEISRRIGYRFQLDEARVPNLVKPGGLLEFQFDIDNVGWGELFNPRNVEVTLRNNDSGQIMRAALSDDPRFWTGGTSQTVETLLSVPHDLPEGVYTLGIAMPDIEPTLHDDVRYAIRFGNSDVWEASTGIHIVKANFVVTSTADGPSFVGFETFAEIDDLANLPWRADFDNNGVFDCGDVDLLVSTIAAGTHTPELDLNGDGFVTTGDLARWRALAGEIQLPGGVAYLPADANLDGVVDAADFNIWNSHKFEEVAAWCSGDFNADGVVDGSDFNIWNAHKFTSAIPATVPEPRPWWLAVLVIPHVFGRMR